MYAIERSNYLDARRRAALISVRTASKRSRMPASNRLATRCNAASSWAARAERRMRSSR